MVFLYSAYDLIRKSSLVSFVSANDGLAVRDNARPLSQMLPLGDIEIRCVGEVDDTTGFVSKAYLVTDPEYHVVNWNSYKFPESPIRPVSNADSKLINELANK